MSRFKKGIENFPEVVKGGFRSYLKTSERIETRAKERLSVCLGCEHFKDEPIDFLKVNNKSTPDADGKYCSDCLCVLNLKIRSEKKCVKWKE